MHGGFGMGGFLPLLSTLLFLILVAVGIVILVRFLNLQRTRLGPSPSGESRPLEILKERYARGEIDTEEYAERKRILTGGDLSDQSSEKPT
jgi:putative membrane protein